MFAGEDVNTTQQLGGMMNTTLTAAEAPSACTCADYHFTQDGSHAVTCPALEPIDVWLRTGDDDHDDFAPLPDGRYPAEANTYMTETGYRVDWYLTAVGQVTRVEFDTLADAYDWLEREGFENFTS